MACAPLAANAIRSACPPRHRTTSGAARPPGSSSCFAPRSFALLPRHSVAGHGSRRGRLAAFHRWSQPTAYIQSPTLRVQMRNRALGRITSLESKPWRGLPFSQICERGDASSICVYAYSSYTPQRARTGRMTGIDTNSSMDSRRQQEQPVRQRRPCRFEARSRGISCISCDAWSVPPKILSTLQKRR